MDKAQNISDVGVNRRLRGAVAGFTVLLAIMVALGLAQAPVWAVALLFVPAFMVSFLAYQSLYKTCVFMATSGERDFGEGAERVACPITSARLKGQAARVLLFSATSAAAMTGLAILGVTGR
jgi:hypothetical protein